MSGGVPDAIEREAVTVSRPRPHVVLLRLAARPLGVLRIAVKRAMLEALDEAERDPEIRALVLIGEGRAFSVGSDVREFELDAGWLRRAEAVENELNDRIEGSRLPVIAALNGHALGGGLVLALACDLRLAAASAKLGVPEVKVGAFASGGGTQRLPRLIGRGRALRLLLTGRIIEAEEAAAIGLVDEVVAGAALLDTALDLAAEIAAMPALAVAASKACVNAGLKDGWARGMALELEQLVTVGLSDDAIEGQRAFIEKREPSFGSGKRP